ncbi:family 43 glycosylhydrolase [Paenibacillus sp. E222]|uniref:family 43 glycosylhydrolase n=1 Tax=Paenibacillus sp. E222 TaxID=2748863 RepID=UPI0015C617F9|nr:family 43 glycosylhydrolase [Paenibacillus sp. E222]QLG40507.1 family 43 glycosylhydrolase [Paenibacillus sp. E222]
MQTSIKPGQIWLDTEGKRIQAHAGSIFYENDTFYWYGENKGKTTPGSGIWHWGVRCYSSKDLYNWQDEGVIIPPVENDPASSLHPTSYMDRPHIIFNKNTGKYICFLKIMEKDSTQTLTIMSADRLLGPYTMITTKYRPLNMSAGDFDLAVARDGKAYYYFERVHSELICADLTADYTGVTGYYSTHFPNLYPPYVREAPAYFTRKNLHYLVTSGTTSYNPNPSEVACSRTFHGPFEILGNPHVNDPTNTSFCSQVSSIFKHPKKKDLYIALADRWITDEEGMIPYDILSDAYDRYFNPDRQNEPVTFTGSTFNVNENTHKADYVWLPFRFDGKMAYLDWKDEWRIEDYD